MTEDPQEVERLKRAIFDKMSPRRQKQVLKRGYEKWDPFLKPKDPIDIRRDRSRRTTQMLINEFMQGRDPSQYSNEYGRGAFELCLGIINEDERYRGMFEFACWYRELLQRELGEDTLS
ncbi:MAG TPA: hypothetical protein VKO20_02385 [Desulfosalsimonadaceae bacterium]|nr:hypothetical protein [Desulfosalsimonadaceae bacterium]